MAADRAALIGRLAEVFRELGFERASLAEIGAATGLGKGSLYHFFPGGKDQMAAEVLADVSDWFEREVYGPLRAHSDDPADDPDDDPDAAIAAMFDNVGRYFRSGRRVCLVGAFALDRTRDRFAVAISRYFAGWVDSLALALAARGHPVAEAPALAAELVAGIQGAITLSRALGDETVFRTILARLRARALAGGSGLRGGAVRASTHPTAAPAGLSGEG